MINNQIWYIRIAAYTKDAADLLRRIPNKNDFFNQINITDVVYFLSFLCYSVHYAYVYAHFLRNKLILYHLSFSHLLNEHLSIPCIII